MSDNVNNPKHYNSGAVECINGIEAALSGEELRGYFKGNILKYVWRERYKNGVEDLKKAQWYLTRLLDHEAMCVDEDAFEALSRSCWEEAKDAEMEYADWLAGMGRHRRVTDKAEAHRGGAGPDRGLS